MDFFTADLHLDHPAILRHSPARRVFLTPADAERLDALPPGRDGECGVRFKPSKVSLARMNDTIIDRLNEAVGRKDRLWVLGDFAVRTTAARTAELRERIRCRDVRLVWGNHDKRPHCRGLFTACYDAVMVHVPPEGPSRTDEEVQDALDRGDLGSREARRMKRVYLSHYAHVVWQASHKGVYHLYGHSHGNLEPWRERAIPSALCFDVGVDGHGFRPWSWEEVDRALSEKKSRVPPHTVDHHLG